MNFSSKFVVQILIKKLRYLIDFLKITKKIFYLGNFYKIYPTFQQSILSINFIKSYVFDQTSWQFRSQRIHFFKKRRTIGIFLVQCFSNFASANLFQRENFIGAHSEVAISVYNHLVVCLTISESP